MSILASAHSTEVLFPRLQLLQQVIAERGSVVLRGV